MRIAYISLHWARTLSSGVGKKIHRQIEMWKSLGHEARLFMHSEDTRAPNLLAGEKFFYPTHKGIPQRELGRIRAAKEMFSALKHYQPDIIFLRDGMYVYPIHRLADIAPIVEEINTNDLEQHKELGKGYSFYNRLTRDFLHQTVSGLSYVSKELSESLAFKKFQKPANIIANGIDLTEFTPLKAPNNDIPRIIFIGSPGYTWHGVDKIKILAQNFPDLKIDVVGYKNPLPNKPLPENLFLHGYLSEKKYLSIFATADLAISSLAMHRVNLTEGSPLKSREYLAYGLPIILAYKDTDLDALNVDFLLKIPNTEDNILTHGKLIHDFAYKMRGKRVDRGILAPLIDTKVKEEKRLTFFKEILEEAKRK